MTLTQKLMSLVVNDTKKESHKLRRMPEASYETKKSSTNLATIPWL
jgi:hypothetical protein